MTDAVQACRIAVDGADWRVAALYDAGDAWIVDVCGPKGETLPIGGPPLVNKVTGNATTLFPPRDGWRLESAVACAVPEQYALAK